MAEEGPTTRNLRLTPPPNVRAEVDDQLSTELDAIIIIGRALSHIPDAETRARVTRVGASGDRLRDALHWMGI